MISAGSRYSTQARVSQVSLRHHKLENQQSAKGADQLCSNCTADQRLSFRYTWIVQFLFFFNIPSIFCDCTNRFVSNLFGNHIVGFLTHRLNCMLVRINDVYCPDIYRELFFYFHCHMLMTTADWEFCIAVRKSVSTRKKISLAVEEAALVIYAWFRFIV